MNFDATDTNTCKSSDDADNSRSADAAVVSNVPAPSNAAFLGAGATYTGVSLWCTSSTHSTL